MNEQVLVGMLHAYMLILILLKNNFIR